MMTNREKTKMNRLMVTCRNALTLLIDIKERHEMTKRIPLDTAIDQLKDVINGDIEEYPEKDIKPIDSLHPRVGEVICTQEFFNDFMRLDDEHRGVRVITWQTVKIKSGECSRTEMIQLVLECPLFDMILDPMKRYQRYTLTYGMVGGDPSNIRLRSVQKVAS